MQSPSARREWIEILSSHIGRVVLPSPSARREWIEILSWFSLLPLDGVSLREEGVD